ncbi:MAG: substrate-binding domain-containing protein [Micromonosporaceae bacterium]
MSPSSTAVFAHDDHLAAGVITAAHAQGRRVPDEALQLTTVRQPFQESGLTAAQTLLRHLTDPKTPIQHTQLQLSLIKRNTT